MLVPVAALLHTIVPVQPVAIKVAFSVPHTFNLSVEITGEAGDVLRLIIISLLEPLSPQASLQIAV
jgi:hypothetical protein